MVQQKAGESYGFSRVKEEIQAREFRRAFHTMSVYADEMTAGEKAKIFSHLYHHYNNMEPHTLQK